MENKNKNQDFDFYNDEEKEEETENFDLNESENSIDLEKGDVSEEDLFSEEEDEEEEELQLEEEDEEEEEGIGDEELEDFEEKEGDPFENIVLSKTKVSLVKQLLRSIKDDNEKLINLLGGLMDEDSEERISISQISDNLVKGNKEEAGKIVEGIFDGEKMVGPDGKQYSVPPNYASKSKLVEGDLLKLTITHKGTFVYKQTKPVERKRLVGKLEKNEAGNFIVKVDGNNWKVLAASITYFKGGLGDEIVLLVPRHSNGGWGAVENIIKNK